MKHLINDDFQFNITLITHRWMFIKPDGIIWVYKNPINLDSVLNDCFILLINWY